MITAVAIYQEPAESLLGRKRHELAERHSELRRREAAHERLADRLHKFRCIYEPLVGHRFFELEELRQRTSRAWGEVRAVNRGCEPEEASRELVLFDASVLDAIPFRPTATLRELFRDLARRIHPDFARNAAEASLRHEFMAEASQAFRLGDAERLRWLIQQWESSPELARGFDRGSRLLRLMREIHLAEQQIRLVEEKTQLLKDSSLYHLMERCDRAWTFGHDLLKQMADDLQEQIDEAQDDFKRVEMAMHGLPVHLTRVIKANAGI